MAEQLQLVAKLVLDSGGADQDIKKLQTSLEKVRDVEKEIVALYGEQSAEAKEAAAAVAQIEGNLNKAKAAGEGIDQPVKNIKQQLREANVELQNAVDKFGIGSKEAANAAAKVAKLKDSIGDAKTLTDAFNPDAKFKGLGNAIQGAAGAFTALQGAQAIFGEESKEVQETLLKVQGALALSQGVNSVLEAGDAFKALGAQAKAALAGIKTGIAATGIGVLLVALGAIVAYWDDIKEAVSGVSSEQEKLNKDSEANLKTQEEKLTAIEGQEQQLKAQGKSEREILQIKIKQTDEAIKAAEINLENAKATKTAQVEAAERNQTILKGLLNFLTAPISALLAGVDLLTSGLNKAGIISDETFKSVGNLRDKFTGGIASLVFDPKKEAEEGDAAIAEAEKKLNGLKEKRAGYQNSVATIDKAAADKRKADAEKAAQEEAALQEKIQKDREDRAKRSADRQNNIDKQIADNRLALIKDGEFKERAILDAGYDDKIAALIKSGEDEVAALNESLKNKLITQAQYDAEIKKLNAQTAAERAAIDEDYNRKRQSITDKYNKSDEEKAKDKAIKSTNEQLANLEAQANNDNLAFEARRNALDAELDLLNKAQEDKTISDEEYTKKVDENAKARQRIAKAEVEARRKLANDFAGILTGLSEVIGKNTKAGKAAAIAGLVIQQAQTVAQITTDTIKSTKAISAKYAGIPGGQIPAAVEIGINVAQGAIGIAKAVQAVKRGIQDIKGANESSAGGAGADVSAGGAGATAPIPPQPETTTINQEQVNQLSSSNAAVRAYVVETDVTGAQDRITRINRAARIG